VELALAIMACLLMEGIFTGAEMVLISADRNKLMERARRGDGGAVIALELLGRPDKAIATTLTGTNIFVVLSTVLTTSRLLPALGPRASLAAIAIVTPLVILLGEIVPKSFAVPRADRLAGSAARFIRVAGYPLYPIVAVVSFLGRLFAKPFGGTEPIHGAVTREDLRLILKMSRAGSDVEPHERTMVRRVFHFGELIVGDIHRALPQVAALPETATCRDAALLAARSGYSRYPVYRDRLDHIVGFLHVLDTVGKNPGEPVQPLLRKALFVPELMHVDDLMAAFRKAATSFAVVVDEFGGVTGIVTAEDVVEEVVGEIEDEYDRGRETPRKVGEGSFLVSARTELARLEESVGIRPPHGDYTTLGGLLIDLAGKIPAAGESYRIPGAVLTVVRASDRAVTQVRIRIETTKEDSR
jgi:CBS domain containing-hemolysin-like protein